MKNHLPDYCKATILLLVSGAFFQASAKDKPVEKPDKVQQMDDATVAEWSKLGYGMFIHYGMSTFTGNEHQRSKVDPALYAPTALDVGQWVRVAKDAGMKYIVLTSKHTAGHCLWDSKVPFRGKEYDYDVALGTDKMDVVGAFVKACEKEGIRPALYYCFEDYVNNSNYRKGGPGRMARNLPADYFVFVKAQLTELLTLYPTVNYLWLDIPVQPSAAQRAEIYTMIKGIRKECLVLYNRGWGKGSGSIAATANNTWPTDIVNTELHPLKPGQFKAKQSYLGETYSVGYEHCDKIGKYWFWAPDEKPRSMKDLLALYKSVQATGGNLLLNVPPDKRGQIPESHVKVLMEVRKEIVK